MGASRNGDQARVNQTPVHVHFRYESAFISLNDCQFSFHIQFNSLLMSYGSSLGNTGTPI